MFSRLRQLKTYPFGLFLWLEWILLGSALLSALLVDLPNTYVWAEFNNPDVSSQMGFILSLLSMLALGIIGLRFPHKSHKWRYFWLQVALIWLPTIYNYKISLSLFLYLIVVIRNGLVFKPKTCQIANILLFLSFVPSFRSLPNFEEYKALLWRYQAMTYEDFQGLWITIIISGLVLYALCIILFWVLVNVL
ncbi:MAG: hypothetical protein QNJ72_36960 [Pleurocapsa sp. MO_226.B13]|nr:hypothetical protein [Pleurocapsa sp. MO_226.B13]